MLDPTLYGLGVLAATIGGTGAVILSLVSWRLYRETPFGPFVGALALAMSGLICYHAVLIVVGESVRLEATRSAVHTAIAVFVWLAIIAHRRIQRDVLEGVDR